MRNAIITLLILTACFADAGSKKQSMRKYSVFARAGGTQGWADPNTYTALWEFETTNASNFTLDTSGNGHNVSNVANGATWTIVGTNVNGRVEHGYLFDGVNDYFFNPDDNWNSSTTSGTIMAWINTTNVADFRVIFASDNTILSSYMLLLIRPTTGKLGFVQRNAVDTPDNIDCDGNLADGSWHHVALVSSGVAWSLYVDGIQKTVNVTAGSNTGDWFSDTTLRTSFTIGRTSHPTTAYLWNGLLDNIAVLNYPMTSNEVYTAFRNTAPDKSIPPDYTGNIRIRP